jgi:flagellar biosynthesis anti-sigma factor FlgM
MKITSKDLIDSGISHLVKNDKGIASVRNDGEKGPESAGGSAKISISPEARYLQKAAELAGRGDELRAEKVAHLKELIAQGEYQIDAQTVAESVARSEVARLLGKQ